MKECPRCHKMTMKDEDVLNSLSRRDNKTYICNDCGKAESYIDFGIDDPDEIERDFVVKVGK